MDVHSIILAIGRCRYYRGLAGRLRVDRSLASGDDVLRLINLQEAANGGKLWNSAPPAILLEVIKHTESKVDLKAACKRGFLDVMSAALAISYAPSVAGADGKARSAADRRGISVKVIEQIWQEACHTGNHAVVSLLADDMRITNSHLEAALTDAAGEGRVDTLHVLVGHQRLSTVANKALYAGIAAASFKNRHPECIKTLLTHPNADPSAMNNFAIISACQNGYADIVSILLDDARVDASVHDDEPIRLASENGHDAVVLLLLAEEDVDPSARDNQAIRRACQNGHTNVVKYLLADPRVDPTADENCALRRASENGHIDIVRILLSDPRVDPAANDYAAVKRASKNGHFDIVAILRADPRTKRRC